MDVLKPASALAAALIVATLLAGCSVQAPEPVVGDIAAPGSEVTGASIVLPAYELKWGEDDSMERILRSATVTYDGMTEGSSADFAELLDADDLATLDEHDIAYFHFTVSMDDGAIGNGQVENPIDLAAFIDTTGANAGEVVFLLGGDAPGGCEPVSGQDLVSKGKSEGCEILVFDKGATLDRVEYIGYTTSIDEPDAPVVWRPTE